MKKWYGKVFLNDVRRGIDDFNMIDDDDRILVAISGGKDSTFLMFALDLIRKYSYKRFDIIALHVDYGFEDHDMSKVVEFCADKGILYYAEKTDLKDALSGEKAPCYICARLRRGVLGRMVERYDCNKLALGHHMDDAVETFFMNLLYNGNARSFKPKIKNPKNSIDTIRPLIYVREDTIKRVTRNEKLPICESNCPYRYRTSRSEVKELINSLENKYTDIREKTVSALKNSRTENFWTDIK